jgi:hypothetical protein
MEKVMSDTALRKWLKAREKWDPDEVFVGHKGFASILDEIPAVVSGNGTL